MDKHFYNEASSKKLGWEPGWFGEKYFDDKLVRAIKKWQKARGLTGDGLCGPMTFRRLWTERQAEIDEHKPADPHYSNYIVFNGELHPIEWDKFVLWSEQGGLKTKPGHYYDYAGRPKRKLRYFVNHWDVCLSATSCQNVLNKRGASVHFLIDNDGTIYQTLDMQHAAWHAGSSRTNRPSVGVEISNAYYTKYQETYVKRGYEERPIIEDAKVHGRTLDPFTGFYPVQLEALKALWKAVHLACDIPLECPTNENGELITTVDRDCDKGRFDGFICHYHLTKRKIDCAGLDLVGLLDEVKSTLSGEN